MSWESTTTVGIRMGIGWESGATLLTQRKKGSIALFRNVTVREPITFSKDGIGLPTKERQISLSVERLAKCGHG